MPSAKHPFYPGEFTWWLNDQGPSKRRIRKADRRRADIFRINSANYRQRLKIDNEALTANAER